MSGARSSHWPLNAFAPPMPTGPTTSGPLPAWSSVASVSFATLPSYVTTSNVTWMSGWAAFQSATTLSSTCFCSGASPPPRQQYQRSSTGAPPADVVDDGASDAALGASVAAALAPPPCEAGAADGAELPHAPASNAVAAIRPSALIRSMAPPGGLRRVVIVTRPRGRADGLIQI